MSHTAVVAAGAGAPLGERFSALSAALALGERTRDAGGHALVVLDDISCMVRLLGPLCAARPALCHGAESARGVDVVGTDHKSLLRTSHGCRCLPAKDLPDWAWQSAVHEWPGHKSLYAPSRMHLNRHTRRDRVDDQATYPKLS